MRAYLFVLPLEPIEIGRVYEHLPIHCTLMHWFWVAATPEELIKKIKTVFEGYGPLELVSAAPALFGPNYDVPVHTLVSNPSLKKLHDKLLAVLDEMGVRHIERKWIGNRFSPHVTTKNGRSFPPESRARINEVYIFEALDAQKLCGKKAVAKLSLLH